MTQSMSTSRRLCPGFEHPVQEAQQVFRQVLGALSEPGSVRGLAVREAPEPLNTVSWQICLALLDQETPVWLAEELRSEDVIAALRFHCGSPQVDRPDAAAFALLGGQTCPDLAGFAQGTHDYPDRSATLIVQVEQLTQGDALEDEPSTSRKPNLILECQGPGIRGVRLLAVSGLAPAWVEALQQNQKGFPRGVDVVLTTGERLVGLPRTTRVRLLNQEE